VFNFLGDLELHFHHAFLDFQSQETKTIGLPSAKKISPTKKYGEKQINNKL
jgi:hypothetical protein